MDDGAPEKGRAETFRRWIATCAAVVSALAPIIFELVRRLGG